MSLKDFFETANAVEFGMRMAAESHPTNNSLSHTRAIVDEATDHLERLERSAEIEGRKKRSELLSEGILSSYDETLVQCQTRLGYELSVLLKKSDELMAQDNHDSAEWEKEAALLFAEQTELLSRIRKYNNIVEFFERVSPS